MNEGMTNDCVVLVLPLVLGVPCLQYVWCACCACRAWCAWFTVCLVCLLCLVRLACRMLGVLAELGVLDASYVCFSMLGVLVVHDV